ncbi:MAG: TlpA family protein disulfide reductase [Verrucomicrobiae bacterium]|nr:TlpA family protein disulfide reductase [Verrucomicrobiae bacterium]
MFDALQPRLFRLAIHIAIALACLPMSQAQEKPSQEESNADSKKEDTTPPSGRLHFLDGNRLPGTLGSANETTLTWNSAFFAEAPSLAYEALEAAVFNRPSFVASPEDNVSITFRDGGRIYGDLVSFDDESVRIRSRRAGELTLSRDAVAELRWLRKGDLVWRGPNGLCDTLYMVKPLDTKRWFPHTDGAIRTVGWKQRLWIKSEIPAMAEFDFEISSNERPEFEVQVLRQLKNFNLRTWDNEVVVRRGDAHLSLMKIPDNERRIHLRLFWDFENDSGAIATGDGKLLGRFRSEKENAGTLTMEDGIPTVIFTKRTLDPKTNKSPDSVTFNNFGRDLNLHHLEIRRWDGSSPAPSTDPKSEGFPRLELADGSVFGAFSGTILRTDGDALLVDPSESPGQTRDIPLSQVEAIVFAPSGKGRPEQNEQFPERAEFADGTDLSGRLLGYEDGRMIFATPETDETVKLKPDGLLRLLFQRRTENLTFTNRDRVTLDKDTITGEWEPAAINTPRWRLSGATAAVPLADQKTVNIQRSTQPDDLPEIDRPGGLLHLASGQTISGELAAIGPDGKWLELRSDLIENTRFDADQIRALQFTGIELETEGFKDRGWKVARGKMGAEVQLESSDDDGKTTDKIALNPGGAWGHASILRGNEVQFKLKANQWGALRVRLFGTSLDSSDDKTTRLLLAHFGNEIYCGVEQTPGDFARRQDINAEPNTPVSVRVVWDEKKLDMFVLGQKTTSINFSPQFPKNGHGLVFEPASLWGNGEREMEVWDFSVKTSPGVVATPAVDSEVRERALLVPRFQRNDLPHHALLAWTGDLLRGTIEAATNDRFSVRAGLESHHIDASRIAAAIWLKPPPPEKQEEKPDTETKGGDPKAPTEKKVEEKPDPSQENAEGNHYILELRDGSRFGLNVEHFGPEFISGQGGPLGDCHVPVEMVANIFSGDNRPAEPGALFANWQLENAPEPTPPEGGGGDTASPLIGKAAPPFELSVLGAEDKFKLEKGRIVVLDFWATWCGPCVRALPEMLETMAGFDTNQVSFVGVNQAEAEETISQFLRQRGWPPFTVALDSRQDVGRAYGVEGIPHTVIIDQEGKVSWVSTGFRPGVGEEVAKRINELLEKAEK